MIECKKPKFRPGTKWNIAGGYIHRPMTIDTLIKIKVDNPAINLSDAFTVYDSHLGLIWNGGREIFDRPSLQTLRTFIDTVEAFNTFFGVGFNLAFSNLCLKEEHLGDKRCNEVLEACHNEKNSVIVSTDILRNYIRTHYPKYKITSSITRTCSFGRNTELFKRDLDLFDIVVLPPDYSYDLDLIQQLGPERLEILVNETCVKNCTHRPEHYRRQSEAHLTYDFALIQSEYIQCPFMHLKTPDNSVALKNEQVDELYKAGIRHFKLQGRYINLAAFRDLYKYIYFNELV